MKYYIATSNLNLDTLLSSEAISPSADYDHHQYGSKLFEKLDQLPTEVTLLFSKIPNYGIHDEEQENYPMVIELDGDAIKCPLDLVYSDDICSVWATQATIILSPWNCRILFFSANAYNMTKIFIDGSRCNKLGDKYRMVVMPSGEYPIEGKRFVPEDFVPSEAPIIDYENNVNKGFLWGTFLGMERSLSPEAASLIKIQNRVHDIASSAISNGGVCAPYFYDELLKLDNEFRIISEKDILDEWNSKYEGISHLLKALRVYHEARIHFYQDHGNKYRVFPPAASSTADVWKRYREISDVHTLTLARQMSRAQCTNPFSNFALTEEINLSCSNAPLISLVLSMIRNQEITKESLRINRLSTAQTICGAISKYFGNQWNESNERKYLLSLYNSIKNFDSFDINSINNDELRVISAIILKGEDIDALMIYAEENTFSNYSLLLGLWGALNGYVDMPRGLLKSVMTLKNINTINEILKHDIPHEAFPENRLVVVRSNESESQTEKIDSSVEQMTDDVVSEENNVGEFESLFAKVFDKCKKATNDSTIYKRLFEEYGLTNALIDAITKEPHINKGKGAPRAVVSTIKTLLKDKEKDIQNVQEQINRRTRSIEKQVTEVSNEDPTLFDQRPNKYQSNLHFDKSFIYDLHDVIKQVNPSLSSSAQKTLFSDLNWVLDPKYASEKAETELLLQFEAKLNKGKVETISDNGKDLSWKTEQYASIDVEKTISALKDACNL